MRVEKSKKDEGLESREYFQTEFPKYKISYLYALFIVVVVFGFVASGMIFFDASLALMFLFSWLVVVPLLMRLGYKYSELQDMAWDMAVSSFEPNMVLLAVGAMIGVWIASGTIPYIIYLGLTFISPNLFLLSALLISSFTSLATGTSWGTMGTVGLALVGVGNALGINPAMTAGAIISGAYFGDKLSPLSDSTILAASVSGTDVITHIKHMLWTTVPSYVLASMLFVYLGFARVSNVYDATTTQMIMGTMKTIFEFSWMELLPIVVVLILLVKKIPSIVALLMGNVAGAIVAVLHQNVPVAKLLTFMMDGYAVNSGSEFVDKLLNRGGVFSMMDAFLAIFLALCISGMLDKTGVLSTLVEPLINRCKNSTFRTILATIVLCYVTNAIGSSMLFASIVTATLMKGVYHSNHMAPENLSRTLEDSGTLGAVLIPWNSNALYASQMLGVGPIAFIPYCFFNWLTPIIALVYAKIGIGITLLNEEADDLTQERIG